MLYGGDEIPVTGNDDRGIEMIHQGMCHHVAGKTYVHLLLHPPVGIARIPDDDPESQILQSVTESFGRVFRPIGCPGIVDICRDEIPSADEPVDKSAQIDGDTVFRTHGIQGTVQYITQVDKDHQPILSASGSQRHVSKTPGWEYKTPALHVIGQRLSETSEEVPSNPLSSIRPVLKTVQRRA